MPAVLLLALAALLPRQELPGSGPVVRVLTDGKGRTWVSEEPFMTLADDAGEDLVRVPRHDLERAYDDAGRALRFGRLLLLEKSGRLWLSVNDNRLWSFDGKEWADRRAPEGARFTGAAIESKDALWFADSLGVQRFDGESWSSHAILPAAGEPRLTADPNGRLWIWTADIVRRWDGREFVKLARLPDEPVLAVVAAGERMLVVHAAGVFAWPDDESREPTAPPDPARAAQCLDEIGSKDPQIRERAEYDLVRLGRDALGPLRAALEPEQNEERRARLRRLIDEIESGKSRRLLVGGHHLVGLRFLWASHGAAWLAGVRNGEKGRETVALRADGESVRGIPGLAEAVDAFEATSQKGDSSFADADGILWISRWGTGLWRFDGQSLKRVPGADEEASYRFLGAAADGAQYWRRVYSTQRMLRVKAGKAEELFGR